MVSLETDSSTLNKTPPGHGLPEPWVVLEANIEPEVEPHRGSKIQQQLSAVETRIEFDPPVPLGADFAGVENSESLYPASRSEMFGGAYPGGHHTADEPDGVAGKLEPDEMREPLWLACDRYRHDGQTELVQFSIVPPGHEEARQACECTHSAQGLVGEYQLHESAGEVPDLVSEHPWQDVSSCLSQGEAWWLFSAATTPFGTILLPAAPPLLAKDFVDYAGVPRRDSVEFGRVRAIQGRVDIEGALSAFGSLLEQPHVSLVVSPQRTRWHSRNWDAQDSEWGSDRLAFGPSDRR